VYTLFLADTVSLSPLTNIAILLMAAGNLLVFAGLVFLAFKIKEVVKHAVREVVDESLSRVQPVITNVTEITGRVSETVATVAPKVERMAQTGESTVQDVSRKVKGTSDIVTERVAKPVVLMASTLAGIAKGWETLRSRRPGQDKT
jgi:predicted PurR-regulated permease PerM